MKCTVLLESGKNVVGITALTWEKTRNILLCAKDAGKLLNKGNKRNKWIAMKRCYFCRGEIVKKKIRHIHQWGDKIILFENIPAEVCKQCGKVYFAPDIVEAMDKGTMQAKKAKESVRVPVISYGELAKT